MKWLYSFLFYAFLWLVRVTPAWVYFPLAAAGVRLFYAFNRKAQQHAIESLGIAFGSQMDRAAQKRLARVSFLNLADGLAGFIFTIGRPELSRGKFTFEGLEKVDAALAKGKGVVIGIAHFGPFVWMLCRFIAQGYKVNVVAKPPRGEFWRKKFQDSFRHTKGLNVILSTPIRTCIVESVRAIESGQLLFMPVDQNYGAAGRVFVPFFGRMAATAPGPAVYTAKTGVPLLMAFAVPDKDGFRIMIEGPVELVRTQDERSDLLTNTRAFTAVVERYIREYPEQWSWMHRRWKCVPKENEGMV